MLTPLQKRVDFSLKCYLCKTASMLGAGVCECRSATCCSGRVAALRLRRAASGQVVCTTACVPSVRKLHTVGLNTAPNGVTLSPVVCHPLIVSAGFLFAQDAPLAIVDRLTRAAAWPVALTVKWP